MRPKVMLIQLLSIILPLVIQTRMLCELMRWKQHRRPLLCLYVIEYFNSSLKNIQFMLRQTFMYAKQLNVDRVIGLSVSILFIFQFVCYN